MDKIDEVLGTKLVLGAGDGSNEPTGITVELDGTSSEIAPTTAETYAADDIYKVATALGDRFWPGSAWLMSRDT